ncbi:MAG: DUF4410 domain-containing protein [Rhodospirillales bacterium]|jgi:hypothetical protein|nr:DUF4410 domain-containing protein [Rhodospirillales bacterium]
MSSYAPILRPLSRPLAAAVLAAATLAGCTSVKVTADAAAAQQLPQPSRILIYDFAVTPDEIQLDPVGSAIAAKMDGTAKSVQEIKTGHAVASALSTHLVARIQGMGLPAQRASGPVPATGTDVLVMGQLVSVDQGNEAERMIIGLGAGRSQVEAHAQVYATVAGKRVDIESMTGAAKSALTPGAAETMGVGALAGHLLVSTAVTAAAQVGNQDLSANVEAEAGRLGDDLADNLKTLFVKQGWVGK